MCVPCGYTVSQRVDVASKSTRKSVVTARGVGSDAPHATSFPGLDRLVSPHKTSHAACTESEGISHAMVLVRGL
jgi:hypothetical protein